MPTLLSEPWLWKAGIIWLCMVMVLLAFWYEKKYPKKDRACSDKS